MSPYPSRKIELGLDPPRLDFEIVLRTGEPATDAQPIKPYKSAYRNGDLATAPPSGNQLRSGRKLKAATPDTAQPWSRRRGPLPPH
ncbi:hypothetical protein EVAR_47483_1 [Eumeta japonica]|uniref:Uncharacterized protein n=1 Tax=Eumeta variegata TaxID=151549 RepID=A0A4C1XEX7_EUMVA|nr:hypothetical protein EVAR_47483_1 [Eumeta japonica]